MDRKYAAFISYRHLPLDKAVATKLQRRLESFVIPRSLRKDGRKRLGLVFRDVEELPLTSSLTDDIHLALDNSDYLIVVCSPQLLESRYCMDEVDYFLKHHSSNRVLTVLVSGTSQTSFPPVLFSAHDEETGEDRPVEPLAANVVSDTVSGSLKLLDREFLRLVAAMLGCPYDALVQRQRRARRMRLALAGAAALLILAVYSGTLLVKNRQISDQLRQTQINESEALAYKSGQLLEQGYGLQALETALQALPGDGADRPVVPAAVNALADALHVYEPGAFVPQIRLDQEMDIFQMRLTEDGSVLITLDYSGTVRAFDATNGRSLWSIRREEGYRDIAILAEKILCVPDFGDSVEIYRPDGTLVGEIQGAMNVVTENDSDMIFCYDSQGLSCYNAQSLEKIGMTPEGFDGSDAIPSCTQSRDGRYCALLCSPSAIPGAGSSGDWRVCCVDMNQCTGGKLAIREYALYTPESVRTEYARVAAVGSSRFAVFSKKGVTIIDPAANKMTELLTFEGDAGFEAKPQVLSGRKNILCVTSKRCACLSAESGELIWQGECSNEGGVQLACWLDNEETGAYWVDGSGALKGYCDIRFHTLTEDGEAASLRAWLAASEMNMKWDAGAIGYSQSADVLALHSPEAANSVLVYRRQRDAAMGAVSEYCAGQDCVASTDDGVDWGGRPLGGYTALEGGRWLLRKTGEADDGERSCYEIISGESGAVVGTVETGAWERPLGITPDGSLLITDSGKYGIADGSVSKGEPEAFEALYDRDAAWRASSVLHESSAILQMYVMEAQKGHIHLEMWKDGSPYWSDDLQGYATAQTPEALWDDAPYFFQMGANGWGSLMLYDAEGGVIGLQLVDAVDHAFHRIEGNVWPVLFAFGERREEPLYMSVALSGQAVLYRCSDAEEIARFELPFAPVSVLEMRFVMDDRAILIRQDYNRLVLLDARSGDKLWSWIPGADYGEGAVLTASSRGNRLYLSLANPADGEYIGGVCVNCDNWTTEKTLPALDQYLPFQDALICYDRSGTSLRFVPCYDASTLIGMGRRFLDGPAGDGSRAIQK